MMPQQNMTASTSAYVLGDLLADDGDDISRRDLFVPAIINAVQHAAGVPHDAVLIHVLQLVAPSVDSTYKELSLIIEKYLDDMSKDGTISRLTWHAEGKTDVSYYPREARFEVSPSRSLVDNLPASLALVEPLSPEDENLRLSLTRILVNTSERHPGVVARVLGDFCPRCGVPQRGHVCGK